MREEIGKIMPSKDESYQNLPIEKSLESGNPPEPRIYHYLFAHKYLPDKLSKSPEILLSWLAGEKGVEHLKTRWGLLPTVYKIESKDYIEPTGIDRYVLYPKDNYMLIIIRFPEPKFTTEAYFSAILFNQKKYEQRYFTLELSFTDLNSNIRKTVLGEWLGDQHINHGDGILPSVEAFSSLIIEKFI